MHSAMHVCTIRDDGSEITYALLSNLQRKAHAFGYKLMRVEEAAAMP